MPTNYATPPPVNNPTPHYYSKSTGTWQPMSYQSGYGWKVPLAPSISSSVPIPKGLQGKSSAFNPSSKQWEEMRWVDGAGYMSPYQMRGVLEGTIAFSGSADTLSKIKAMYGQVKKYDTTPQQAKIKEPEKAVVMYQNKEGEVTGYESPYLQKSVLFKSPMAEADAKKEIQKIHLKEGIEKTRAEQLSKGYMTALVSPFTPPALREAEIQAQTTAQTFGMKAPVSPLSIFTKAGEQAGVGYTWEGQKISLSPEGVSPYIVSVPTTAKAQEIEKERAFGERVEKITTGIEYSKGLLASPTLFAKELLITPAFSGGFWKAQYQEYVEKKPYAYAEWLGGQVQERRTALTEGYQMGIPFVNVISFGLAPKINIPAGKWALIGKEFSESGLFKLGEAYGVGAVFEGVGLVAQAKLGKFVIEGQKVPTFLKQAGALFPKLTLAPMKATSFLTPIEVGFGGAFMTKAGIDIARTPTTAGKFGMVTEFGLTGLGMMAGGMAMRGTFAPKEFKAGVPRAVETAKPEVISLYKTQAEFGTARKVIALETSAGKKYVVLDVPIREEFITTKQHPISVPLESSKVISLTQFGEKPITALIKSKGTFYDWSGVARAGTKGEKMITSPFLSAEVRPSITGFEMVKGELKPIWSFESAISPSNIYRSMYKPEGEVPFLRPAGLEYSKLTPKQALRSLKESMGLKFEYKQRFDVESQGAYGRFILAGSKIGKTAYEHPTIQLKSKLKGHSDAEGIVLRHEIQHALQFGKQEYQLHQMLPSEREISMVRAFEREAFGTSPSTKIIGYNKITGYPKTKIERPLRYSDVYLPDVKGFVKAGGKVEGFTATQFEIYTKQFSKEPPKEFFSEFAHPETMYALGKKLGFIEASPFYAKKGAVFKEIGISEISGKKPAWKPYEARAGVDVRTITEAGDRQAGGGTVVVEEFPVQYPPSSSFEPQVISSTPINFMKRDIKLGIISEQARGITPIFMPIQRTMPLSKMAGATREMTKVDTRTKVEQAVGFGAGTMLFTAPLLAQKISTTPLSILKTQTITETKLTTTTETPPRTITETPTKPKIPIIPPFFVPPRKVKKKKKSKQGMPIFKPMTTKRQAIPLPDIMSIIRTEARTGRKATFLMPTPKVRKAFAKAVARRPFAWSFPTAEEYRKRGKK